ncbi:MAG: BamA/TamA family outer membrane protein, partial [Elusimicrobia bacterium]|nr:BamA/TamA family outer membrane protein [Elusimicrobiota bacterium]
MGGGTTVRGYRERGIGPKSPEGDPLGGIRQLGGSAELRYPIISRLRGAIFIDGGQVGDHWDDVRPRHWKWGAGTGIRFLTPVGPFRLDWGHKLNHDPDDRSRYRFHFSLGESF